MAEPEVSDSNKQLSLLEKLKLLKISCKHGPRLLRCSTMGKHPEKDVWTSIMEEFSSTVRAGVFKKYTQVKTANNSMCRSRRRHTKGTIPPQRRSRMTNLDTWIDKWVRIWKCRDMIIRIANAHQGIRETIGEKKLKKIFRNRIDGTELPQELGVLTLSYPLWKAIQKRIRAVERSSKGRDFSICSDEDESYSTDDELDSDPMLDTGKDEPVLQSIETHIQPTISPAPEDSTKDLAPTQPDQRVLVTPESPSLPQRAGERLKELGKDFIDVLKASRGAKGKNVSVLELAQRSTSQQQVSSPQTSPHPQEAHIGNPPRPQSKNKGKHISGAIPVVETPRSEQGQTEHNDIHNNASPSSAKSQRLKPGTYSAGESVLIGWHSRQLLLAGVNVTAEQDYRQSVSATISTIGIMNLRLRSRNIQGRIVPSKFRLGKTISVSRKDVVYHPAFHGMSHEEIRLEVARRSLLNIDQRVIVRHQTSTPITRRSDATNVELEIPETPSEDIDITSGVEEDVERVSTRKAGRSGASTPALQTREAYTLTNRNEAEPRSEKSPYIPTGANRQADTPPEASRVDSSVQQPRQSMPDRAYQLNPTLQGLTSRRTDTPKISKNPFADKATKTQTPSKSVEISRPGSPPRKPNPKSQKPRARNRITPMRFYGKKPLEHNPAAKARSSPSRRAHGRPWASRTAGFYHNDGVTYSGTLSPRPISLTQNYDISDDESLPDVEELFRRRSAKETQRSGDQSTSQGPQTSAPTGAIPINDAPTVRSDLQTPNSAHKQTDTQSCPPKAIAKEQERINTDIQNLQADAGSVDAPSNSGSRKRPRSESQRASTPASWLRAKSLSRFPDGSGTSYLRNTTPQGSGKTTSISTSDTRPAKKQKRSSLGRASEMRNLAGPSKSGSGSASGTASTSRDDCLHGTELRLSNNFAESSKGVTSRRHTKDDYPPSAARPSKTDKDTRTSKPSASLATPAKSKKRPGQRQRKRMARQRSERPREKGRVVKRSAREKTTDTVDFDNFSDDNKLDTLWRKYSQIEEIVREMEKRS